MISLHDIKFQKNFFSINLTCLDKIDNLHEEETSITPEFNNMTLLKKCISNINSLKSDLDLIGG